MRIRAWRQPTRAPARRPMAMTRVPNRQASAANASGHRNGAFDVSATADERQRGPMAMTRVPRPVNASAAARQRHRQWRSCLGDSRPRPPARRVAMMRVPRPVERDAAQRQRHQWRVRCLGDSRSSASAEANGDDASAGAESNASAAATPAHREWCIRCLGDSHLTASAEVDGNDASAEAESSVSAVRCRVHGDAPPIPLTRVACPARRGSRR
jgi:hypothetical protein